MTEEYREAYDNLVDAWGVRFYDICQDSPKDARKLLWLELCEWNPFAGWPLDELLWVIYDYSDTYFTDAYRKTSEPRSLVGFMDELATRCLWYDAIDYRKRNFGPI